MYLTNLTYRQIGRPESDGFVTLPSTLRADTLKARRKNTSRYEGGVFLLDPQVYLTMHCKSKTAVEKLASYPWIRSNASNHVSGELSPLEYDHALEDTQNVHMEHPAEAERQCCIADCLRFQDEVGVTWPILPSPLIEGPDTLDHMLEWVDRGISEADPGREPLASIALSDEFLQDESGVEALIDNLLSRPLTGAYITLLRHEDSRRPFELRGCSLILKLVRRLSSKRWRVITNFMDDFGLLCVALGGAGYATGYSNRERRLVRSDLEDKRGYGKQYPYFYSRSFFADFHPIEDLEQRFARRDLLWLFDEDNDVYSRPLLAGLRDGLKANDIPSWRVRQANVEAAALHRAHIQRQACGELVQLDTERRVAAIIRMLQNARRNVALIQEEFSTDPATADLRHVRPWLAAVQQATERGGT